MTDLERYEQHYNDCERANRIPLTFEEWKERHADNDPD